MLCSVWSKTCSSLCNLNYAVQCKNKWSPYVSHYSKHRHYALLLVISKRRVFLENFGFQNCGYIDKHSGYVTLIFSVFSYCVIFCYSDSDKVIN